MDTETKDTQLRELGPGVRRPGNHLVGVSFCIEDGPKHYLPLRHEGGGNLDPEAALGYLREQAAAFDGLVVGMNLQYDLDWLWENGVYFPNCQGYRDVMIAEPLIDELQDSYSLDAIAERRALGGKEHGVLEQAAIEYGIDPKKDLWRLHSRFVGEYAEQDASLPLLIHRKQEFDIEDQDLWEVFGLESELLPALVRMRRRGVLVDERKLGQNEREFMAEEMRHLEVVRREAGLRLAPADLWKAEACAKVLDAVGVPYGQTRKGQPNIDKALFASVDHPAVHALERARAFDKARRDYVVRVRDFMTNGRVHPTFNQLRREKDEGGLAGAAYGRMSCEEPNLQQVPGRDPEIGSKVRSQYVAEDGCLWAANDYSQQEPRMTVHFAELARCRGAHKAGDRYREDPSTDNHQMMADMAGIPRKDAKIIFLGLCYGMGGAKLCNDLGLPTRWRYSVGKPWDADAKVVYAHDDKERREAARWFAEQGLEPDVWEVAGEEGQRLLDTFHSEVPFVRELSKKVEKQAAKMGYIKTLSGRRCRFPEKHDVRGGGRGKRYDWVHKGLNRLIQGSSGDQTKRAVVEVDRAGYFLQLQVHDELGQSVENEKQARAIADIMTSCVQLTVPSKVDVEIGPSWGEAA